MMAMAKEGTLIKPSYQDLIDAIDDLEMNPGEECCRNCFQVNGDVYRCAKCEVNRCRNCRAIHQQIEEFFMIYGILELGLSPVIMESLFKVYRVNVNTCSGCWITSCSRCSAISCSPVSNEWFCVNCIYKCEKCSRKLVYEGGKPSKKERVLCRDCKKYE